ncbi:TonB-dependent receptor [Sphingomonas sp. AP4-R1]|uniref:TonB-dependent receptor n=1 Tax=Sphingomonas sp. AP4-R1 TaxID=2735134 RepID=UPI001493A82F|nr:TonB-dependent receptor [Sphingomonas sp. AP4-R1]QJU59865.1 TonB-dependent receptor [Sphingomonas sp. AP4-R1]
MMIDFRRGTGLPALAAALLFAASTPALAAAAADAAPAPDAAAAADSDGLNDIVVTAQKRETNLQRTPIAIAVLGGDDLANRHVLSLTDLGDGSIPSLRVAPFFARKSALVVNIRGVGALGDANQPAREQGAGVYLNGVYLGRAQGLGAALYDVERIEVLKGPQGTLFGRNTEGGAISIVTKKPSGEFHFDGTAGVSNFGGYEGAMHVDLPAVGNIAVKVDGLVQKRSGTIKNPMAGQEDFNGYDRRGGHIAARWQPSADFSATYEFDISRDGTTPYLVELVSRGSLTPAPIMQPTPYRLDTAQVGVPLQQSVGHTHGHMLNLEWHLDDRFQLKSISSYRKLDQSQYDNGASVLSVYAPNANFARNSLANFYQHQYSEELQFLGDLGNVNFVSGLFYYHERVRDNAWSPNTLKFNADGTGYTVLSTPGIAQSPFPDRASIAKTDSAAVFGQATWTPPVWDERLHLTAGGRYSHDKKDGELYLINGFTPVVNGVTGALPMHVKSNRVDPLVNIALDLTRTVHVYGKWSTGYRAAGANSRSLTYRAFGPESVSEFEIGAKTEFLDRRVRLNVAAYTGQYKNVQIDFNALIPGANRTTLETTNANGNGRIKGFEADITVAPLPGLTLNGSYAYTSVRLPEAPNPFVTGNPLVPVYPVYTPKNALSGAIDYSLPVGGAGTRIVAHLDANAAGRQYTTSSDPTKSDKSFTVNGRLSLADIRMNDGGAKLQVSVWARNLFNNDFMFLKNFSSALGTYAIYNEARTYGLEGRLTF